MGEVVLGFEFERKSEATAVGFLQMGLDGLPGKEAGLWMTRRTEFQVRPAVELEVLAAVRTEDPELGLVESCAIEKIGTPMAKAALAQEGSEVLPSGMRKQAIQITGVDVRLYPWTRTNLDQRNSSLIATVEEVLKQVEHSSSWNGWFGKTLAVGGGCRSRGLAGPRQARITCLLREPIGQLV